MKNHNFISFTLLIVIFLLSNFETLKAQCNGDTDSNNLKVILKMDDIRDVSNDTYNSSWQRLADTVRAYDINAAMGPVMVDLTTGSQAFKDSLKSWHESEFFEIWHHGWTHTRSDYPPDNNNAGEFSGTPYEYQKTHFEDGMKIAQSELGITIRTFGAPYNQTDLTFTQVIEESPDVKVWLYCGDSNYSEMCLFRGSNNKLESSTGVVSFDSFLSAYNSNTNPYLVLQGHPGQWTTASFEQFEMVIDFLKEEESCFILPYDYYKQEVDNPLLYTENFDNPDSIYLNHDLTKVDVSQTCCGELKIKMKDGETLAQNEPLIHKIAVNGAENTVDIEETTKIYMRVRSEVEMDLRLDLSDGINTTDGVNGQLTQSIPAGLNDWTTLVFDFPLSSYEEVSLKTQQISEVRLFPDPSADNFAGSLYIDYISIGSTPEDSAKCRSDIDRDGCTALFEDQFDDEKVNLSGDFLGVIDTLESGCGELVLSMKSESTLPNNEAIYYSFPEAIDFTKNPKLVVRLRSSARFDLRLDISDGTNATDGVNGKITNEVPSNSFVWTELVYNFPQIAFEENNVDSTAINNVAIYLDPDEDNFPGTLYIDFISAGMPTAIGNAIGKTEVDSCGLVTVISDTLLLGNNTVGVENGLLIYPNPTSNQINIQWNEKWSNARLKVHEISGKEVYTYMIPNQEGEVSIDTNSLHSGVYFIVVEKGDALVRKRILKD